MNPFDRALDLHQRGNLDEAESLYRALLDSDPRHADATHFLGVLARQTDRPALGMDLLKQSIDLAPDNADFHYRLGNALDEDCRFEEAADAYRRALALNSRLGNAAMNLGVVLQTLGRFDDAIEVLEKLVEQFPAVPVARFNLARACESVGRQVEGIAQLRHAATHQRSAETLIWLGSALRRFGEPAEAIAHLEQAAALAPNHLEAWLELGHAHHAAQQRIEAAAAFRQALRIDPAHADAAFFLAQAQGETPAGTPAHVVREMYDGYADHFDHHLLRVLKYDAPAQLHRLVAGLLPHTGPTPPLDILDAGCGTGLAAPLFAPLARSLIGVDLSPNMIRQARTRKLYTELCVADIVEALAARPGSADLVIALEVLIHLGDLAPFFAAAAGALRPGGLLALSVEAHEGDDFSLLSTRRFAHGLAYLRAQSQACQLVERALHTTPLRQERGQPVIGHLMVLQKSA